MSAAVRWEIVGFDYAGRICESRPIPTEDDGQREHGHLPDYLRAAAREWDDLPLLRSLLVEAAAEIVRLEAESQRAYVAYQAACHGGMQP